MLVNKVSAENYSALNFFLTTEKRVLLTLLGGGQMKVK